MQPIREAEQIDAMARRAEIHEGSSPAMQVAGAVILRSELVA